MAGEKCQNIGEQIGKREHNVFFLSFFFVWKKNCFCGLFVGNDDSFVPIHSVMLNEHSEVDHKDA